MPGAAPALARRSLTGVRDFDAIWFDAGGVLVLPDPTVIAALLEPYGGSGDVDRHRRAHYGAMAVKSRGGHGESEWFAYDEAYVEWVGVDAHLADVAARLLGACRVPDLWRWPIPESVTALAKLHASDVPIGVVSNASGQIEATLARSRVCQVGDGPCVPVRCVVDSHVVGVAKPDPRIFDFAAEHFPGIDRDRVLYVGDSITMDVAGAAAAGLVPVLLDPYDDHVGADFARIGSLGDLL